MLGSRNNHCSQSEVREIQTVVLAAVCIPQARQDKLPLRIWQQLSRIWAFLGLLIFMCFLIMKSSEEKPVVSRYKAIAVG